MAAQRAVGIDLGTTFSAAAWIDPTGKTAMIHGPTGETLTRSAAYFEDHSVIVGNDARRAGTLKPERYVECVKRDMGQSVHERPLLGEYYPPEALQACILHQLRQDITREIGPDFSVVITAPAFFDEPRRRATAIAGEIAGLKVLDIVNEPTAAALAYGERLGVLRTIASHRQAIKVLVYDLGGGTFDATLLEIHSQGFRTLATDGDVFLGGRDWDERLADLACRAFVARYGADPRVDAVTRQRLLFAAEQAKHTLSARRKATVRFDREGRTWEAEISREQFEAAASDLLERTAHTVREILKTAGVGWNDIDRILIVGGSTRMPMVPQMLGRISGKPPSEAVSPDEAIARGAAIYARWLLDSASGQPAPYRITDVNSHSLGVAGVVVDSRKPVHAVIIPKNSPLPVKVTRTFVTKTDNQRSIVIRVLEGESRDPNECTLIGHAVIRDLPPGLPRGHRVQVTYEYQANGRLHVEAAAVDTNSQIQFEIVRNSGLPDEWIGPWKKVVTQAGGLAMMRQVLKEQTARSHSAPPPLENLLDAQIVDWLDAEEVDSPPPAAPKSARKAKSASQEPVTLELVEEIEFGPPLDE